MSKNKIGRLEVEHDNSGFSVWLDDKWIIDASMIMTHGLITIDNRNFELDKDCAMEHHLNFRLRKRKLK